MSFVRKAEIAAYLAIPLFTGCAATEEPRSQPPALEQRVVEEEGALLQAKKAIEDKQPERAIALLDSLKGESFDHHTLRAKAYCLMADDVKVPQVFDSKMPKAEMIRQIKDASGKKHNLYEDALKSYRRAKELKDDIGIDKLIAATYWHRHLALFSPLDAKMAEQGFLDIIKKSPEQSDAYALLGGIYVWYAKTTTSRFSEKKYLNQAYMKFVEAKIRHEKKPLEDKMLEYVHESIKALEDKIPNERDYH